MLGIVPTREDVVKEIGGVTDAVYENLENDNIVLMPSNAAVSQIWTPTQTFFADITKDVFRSESDKKYKTNEEKEEFVLNPIIDVSGWQLPSEIEDRKSVV